MLDKFGKPFYFNTSWQKLTLNTFKLFRLMDKALQRTFQIHEHFPLYFFSISFLFMPSGCIDHEVKQSCVFPDEVNSELICTITQQHTHSWSLYTGQPRNQLPNLIGWALIHRKCTPWQILRRANGKTPTNPPMATYLLDLVIKPAFVTFKLQLFCLEFVSDSPCQATDTQIEGTTKQTRKVT